MEKNNKVAKTQITYHFDILRHIISVQAIARL